MTLWLTGIPGAGKSTVARLAETLLSAKGIATEVLDGDEVRPILSAELGYSRRDRDAHVLRVGWVARLLSQNGAVVLVPVIAPYAKARQAVRADHAAHSTAFGEVYVSAPLEVVMERDPKGLYRRYARGEVSGLTGADDPYEAPEYPELVLETAASSRGECAGQVVALAQRLMSLRN